LVRDAAEFISCHPLAIAIGVEETDDSFGLLEGLDKPVQQQSVKAPVVQPNATLVMLEESVHGVPPAWSDTRKHNAMNARMEAPLPSAPRDIKGGALG
jgi:hypothetical protein